MESLEPTLFEHQQSQISSCMSRAASPTSKIMAAAGRRCKCLLVVEQRERVAGREQCSGLGAGKVRSLGQVRGSGQPSSSAL